MVQGEGQPNRQSQDDILSAQMSRGIFRNRSHEMGEQSSALGAKDSLLGKVIPKLRLLAKPQVGRGQL